MGDRWARFNFALRLLQAGERFAICLPDPLAWEMAAVLDLSSLQPPPTLLSRLDTPACERLARRIDTGDAAYRCQYYPTSRRPHAGGRKLGYCFSANWRAEEKIPPGIDDLLTALAATLPGWTLVPLGRPHQSTLRQLVETLSEVRCLLSVDNGVAHVARSVGTPLFLLEHTLPVSRGFPTDAAVYTKVTIQTAVAAIRRLALGGEMPVIFGPHSALVVPSSESFYRPT